MINKNLVVITVEQDPEFTLEELSSAAGVSEEFIQQMIEYGAIELVSRFDANHLRRVRMARHLQHDLEINFAGVALTLDLMDEMERMRARLELFEKFFSHNP